MTENKRFISIGGSLYDTTKAITDGECMGVFIDRSECENVCDLLNEQEETIQELKTRNKRQYERLKEVWDLIFDRNWEELEKKATEMEENEKRLQREYGG